MACWNRDPASQVGGSIPERANGGRLYNTCFVYGRDGRLLGRHRKVGAWYGPLSMHASRHQASGAGRWLLPSARCCPITLQLMLFLAPIPSQPLFCPHWQVHLFDIDIPGKITFKESLTLTPGEGLTVVDSEASLERQPRGPLHASCCAACLLEQPAIPPPPCPQHTPSNCRCGAGGAPGHRHLL